MTKWRSLPTRLMHGEGGAAGEARGGAELFLDAQQLVVFGDAVGAGGGAGLDLARAHGDGEIGDEGIFGFAGAVRDDRGVAGLRAISMASIVSVTRADLIQLDENGIGDAFGDAAREDVRYW